MSKHWMDQDEHVARLFAARDKEIAELKARLAEAEKDRSHLRGLIALCVTRAEAYGSAEFAKVLRSALRTTDRENVSL